MFAWRLELVDGHREVVDVAVRANNAFDRGLHMPQEWATFCSSRGPSTASRSREAFSAATARDLAEAAVHRAVPELGEGHVDEVTCTCALLF